CDEQRPLRRHSLVSAQAVLGCAVGVCLAIVCFVACFGVGFDAGAGDDESGAGAGADAAVLGAGGGCGAGAGLGVVGGGGWQAARRNAAAAMRAMTRLSAKKAPVKRVGAPDGPPRLARRRRLRFPPAAMSTSYADAARDR